VIALGGGALETDALFEQVRKTGTLVFLEWPIDVLCRRVGGDLNRPLAQDEAVMRARYHQRLPRYRQADLIWRARPPFSHPVPEIAAWIAAHLPRGG
jgi:shikimate kinase